LRGRGVRIEVEDLSLVPYGAILHWTFNHFVVFDGIARKGVKIVDPAVGSRIVPWDEFRRCFTGVVVLLEKTGEVSAPAKSPSVLGAYLPYVRGARGHWASMVVLSLVLQVFTLASPIVTGAIVDRIVPARAASSLRALGAVVALALAFHFILSLARGRILVQLRAILESRITHRFVDHLVSLPYAFFQQRSSGDLMMRLNSNSVVREILTGAALAALLDGTMVIVYLALVFVARPETGLVVLGLASAQAVLLVVAARKQRELAAAETHAQASLQSFQVEMLAGIESLKAVGGEFRAVEAWSNLFSNVMNASLRRGTLSATYDAVLGAIRIGSPVFLLFLGADQVLRGELSLGTMLATTALSVGCLMPISNLVSTAMHLQILPVYMERITDVLHAAPEQCHERVARAPTLQGAIELEKVSFRYAKDSAWVVRDVSLRIQPGQLVAIVGRSGAGKSTLAHLLAGLYTPSSGLIHYDGIDLATLDWRSVREQLGIVFQRPYLFGTTVRANIALANATLSLDAVIEASKTAGLHDEIVAMPMGYETSISDGGSSLSGGQCQRLALARALVHRPAILLLDEATSALDPTTERKVQRALSSLRCTRVVIAHRLSTIVSADVILVMDGGEVVDRGTHAELLSRCLIYRELVGGPVSVLSPAARPERTLERVSP
jgi:ABC-type bacteriocin/lantibiotic exporter with double-glycine peptidase domain